MKSRSHLTQSRSADRKLPVAEEWRGSSEVDATRPTDAVGKVTARTARRGFSASVAVLVVHLCSGRSP